MIIGCKIRLTTRIRLIIEIWDKLVTPGEITPGENEIVNDEINPATN